MTDKLKIRRTRLAWLGGLLFPVLAGALAGMIAPSVFASIDPLSVDGICRAVAERLPRRSVGQNREILSSLKPGQPGFFALKYARLPAGWIESVMARLRKEGLLENPNPIDTQRQGTIYLQRKEDRKRYPEVLRLAQELARRANADGTSSCRTWIPTHVHIRVIVQHSSPEHWHFDGNGVGLRVLLPVYGPRSHFARNGSGVEFRPPQAPPAHLIETIPPDTLLFFSGRDREFDEFSPLFHASPATTLDDERILLTFDFAPVDCADHSTYLE